MNTDLNFNEVRVMVIGDIMLDEYIEGKCTRVSPEAPVPVIESTSTYQVMGGAGNVAANIASLGGKVTLFGRIGVDDSGKELTKLIKDNNIDIGYMDSSFVTTKKTRVIANNQQIARIDNESITYTEKESLGWIMANINKNLSKCDIIVISDYAKGFLTKELCQEIIELANKQDKEVIVDPKPAHASFYNGCTYITPNLKEYTEMMLYQPETEDRSIFNVVDTENVVLSLGEDGVALFDRYDESTPWIATSRAKEVYDVSGAGDTLVAVLALCLSLGMATGDAVAEANKAAGIVVGKKGTSTLTIEEFNNA